MTRIFNTPAVAATIMMALSSPALAGEKPEKLPVAPKADMVPSDTIDSPKMDSMGEGYADNKIMTLPGEMPKPAQELDMVTPASDDTAIETPDAPKMAPDTAPEIDCPADTTAQPDGTCLATGDFD